MAVGLAVMADRYTYIPYIGLAFMFVYVADDWVSEKSVLIKYAALGIAAFFITLLTIKSIKQVEVWHDSESLWTQVLQYYPKEDLALANRGNYRGKTGNIQGAMADFETAIADGCHRADVYEGLGNSYGTMSEQLPDKKQAYVSKAIEMYQNALAIEPTKGNIQYNLGVAQMQTNPAASEIAFTEALRLMPYKEKDILPVLGLSQVNAGKYNEAIRTLSRVIDSGQGTDILYYHRGLANLGAGNKDAARADFTQSLKINPQNQEVRQRLATM
jgi:tetratricopeptide (TPR) repeat protein